MNVTETPKLKLIEMPLGSQMMVTITWTTTAHANQYEGEIKITPPSGPSTTKTFSTTHPCHMETVPKGTKVLARVRGKNIATPGNDGPWSNFTGPQKNSRIIKIALASAASILAVAILCMSVHLLYIWLKSSEVSSHQRVPHDQNTPQPGPASPPQSPPPPSGASHESSASSDRETSLQVQKIVERYLRHLRPLTVVTTVVVNIGDNNDLTGSTITGVNGNNSPVNSFNGLAGEAEDEPVSTDPADYKPVCFDNQAIPPWAQVPPSKVLVLPTTQYGDIEYSQTVEPGENQLVVFTPGCSYLPFGNSEYVDRMFVMRGGNRFYRDATDRANRDDGMRIYARPNGPEQTIRWRISPIPRRQSGGQYRDHGDGGFGGGRFGGHSGGHR